MKHATVVKNHRFGLYEVRDRMPSVSYGLLID